MKDERDCNSKQTIVMGHGGSINTEAELEYYARKRNMEYIIKA